MKWSNKYDYNYLVRSHEQEIRKAVRGCRTLLDLGCGPASLMARMKWEYSVGIEGYKHAATSAQADRTHNEVICCELKEIGRRFEPGAFDAVVALDVIEHFEKNEGFSLLEKMESIAKRIVIISTPNGFLSQQQSDNPLQEHLSGWDYEEMAALGYEVKGLYGPKGLRGEYHLPKYHPTLLFSMLSRIIDRSYMRTHPKHAAAIFCVKRK